jgi:hypothetical protein
VVWARKGRSSAPSWQDLGPRSAPGSVAPCGQQQRHMPSPDFCPLLPSSTVVTATLAETGLVSLGTLLLLASRLLFVTVSLYYYYQVGRKPKKV